MFKNKFSLILLSLLIGALLLGSNLSLVFAQSSNSAPKTLQVQGLSIDPFLIEADLTPGQSSEFGITVTNTTDAPLSFEVSINDFITNGRNGQPLFLSSTEKSDPKYSLSEWVKITQQPKFKIAPHQQTTINFTITPPIDAELGTHYGGLLFGQPEQLSRDQSTLVENKAGAIILGKLGKAQEQGIISRFFSQQSWFTSSPFDLVLAFHNFGNVHSKPKGTVVVRNMFGQQVADLPVNKDALIILPETEREFELSWRPSWAFGRYTAEAIMFFGNPKLEVRSQTSFWVLPVFPILAGVCVIIVLALGGYAAVIRYNRYIINRAKNELK